MYGFRKEIPPSHFGTTRKIVPTKSINIWFGEILPHLTVARFTLAWLDDSLFFFFLRLIFAYGYRSFVYAISKVRWPLFLRDNSVGWFHGGYFRWSFGELYSLILILWGTWKRHDGLGSERLTGESKIPGSNPDCSPSTRYELSISV